MKADSYDGAAANQTAHFPPGTIKQIRNFDSTATSQMGEGVLLGDVYVSGGDSATRIDIIAEVIDRDRLKGLRFAQISITTGDNSAGIYVTNQHIHTCA